MRRRRGNAGAAVARLRAATRSGRLDRLCADHDVALLVLFGSATTESEPGDVDLAHLPGDATDVLGLLDALVVLVGDDRVDLVDLSRAGPVVSHRALTGIGLYEDEPGRFARMRDLALRQYLDTAHLRRVQAEVLAR